MFLVHLLGMSSRATVRAVHKAMPLAVQCIHALRDHEAANPSKYADARQVRTCYRIQPHAVVS
jgi:hypothetical protein